MSLDINELVRLVKQAAVDAVRAEAPVAVCYGTVTASAPLKIQVDQKKILGEAQIILTGSARTGVPLKTGEHVLLLRCDGGQKYVILDRWGAER